MTVFAMQRYASMVYMAQYPSVHTSGNQCCNIAQGLLFCDTKDADEIPMLLYLSNTAIFDYHE